MNSVLLGVGLLLILGAVGMMVVCGFSDVDPRWAPLTLIPVLMGLTLLIMGGHGLREEERRFAQVCVESGGFPYRGDCLRRNP